jgi:hypothetical protein
MSAESPGGQAPSAGLRSDQVSGLMLVALALFIGWENRVYPVGTLAEPGPGYLPLILAIFIGLMGVLIVAWGAKSAPLASLKWVETPRAVVILVACAIAAACLEPLGYRVTIIGLLVFFLGVVERRPPLIAGFVAVGFGLVSFYVIGDLLHVPLPRSRWGF